MKKIICLVITVVFIMELTACNNGDKFTLSSSFITTDSTNTNIKSYNSKTDLINYYEYQKKIWVADNVNGFIPCIYINSITDGIIEGKWSLHPILPDCYVDSFETIEYGTLTGAISNDAAQCQFKDESGDGVIKLTFKQNVEIDAVISFKTSKNKNEYPEGEHIFRPYNIDDHSVLTEKKSYPVELDFWGDVNITTGYIEAPHPYAVAYITDNDNNILYQFKGLTNGYKILDVLVKDVNKDGLNDINIKLAHPSLTISYIFIQMENGLFYDSKLDNNLSVSFP